MRVKVDFVIAATIVASMLIAVAYWMWVGAVYVGELRVDFFCFNASHIGWRNGVDMRVRGVVPCWRWPEYGCVEDRVEMVATCRVRKGVNKTVH